MKVSIQVDKAAIDTIHKRLAESFNIYPIGGMGGSEELGFPDSTAFGFDLVEGEQTEEGRTTSMEMLQLPEENRDIEYMIPCSGEHGVAFGVVKDEGYYVAFDASPEKMRAPNDPVGTVFKALRGTGRIAEFEIFDGPEDWWKQGENYH